MTVADGSEGPGPDPGPDPDPDPDPDPPEPPGKPAFAATLAAPNYALADTTLSYQLSVANTGTRDADNATVTLTWDQAELVPESSGGNCSGSPLTCSWSVSLAAEDDGDWDTSLSVTVPRAAEFGDVIERAAQRKRCRKWRHRQRLGHDHGRCPARSGAGDDRFATAGGCPRRPRWR